MPLKSNDLGAIKAWGAKQHIFSYILEEGQEDSDLI